MRLLHHPVWRLPQSARLSEKVSIGLTPAMKAWVTAEARRLGRDRAAYIRELIEQDMAEKAKGPQ